MKRITVDLPDDLYERLRLLAFNAHSSVSQVIRDRLATSLPARDTTPRKWEHKGIPPTPELRDAPKETGR